MRNRKGSEEPVRLNFKLAASTKPVVIVPVTVNGIGPYDFALDTGASTCIVSPQLSQELRITPTSVQEGLGAGGRVSVSLSTVDELAVGTAKTGKVQVAITDLAPLSQAVGMKLDGIIGFNFLRIFRLTIDYPNGVLQLE